MQTRMRRTDSVGILKGFTLIELLVVIAIIGILSSVVLASLNAARARGRYANALQQMEQIARAADLDYLTRGAYAPDAGRGVKPAFADLAVWPEPPCEGWLYDWDNVSGGVTIGMKKGTSGPEITRYCLEGAAACPGTDIRNRTSKEFTCNE